MTSAQPDDDILIDRRASTNGGTTQTHAPCLAVIEQCVCRISSRHCRLYATDGQALCMVVLDGIASSQQQICSCAGMPWQQSSELAQASGQIPFVIADQAGEYIVRGAPPSTSRKSPSASIPGLSSRRGAHYHGPRPVPTGGAGVRATVRRHRAAVAVVGSNAGTNSGRRPDPLMTDLIFVRDSTRRRMSADAAGRPAKPYSPVRSGRRFQLSEKRARRSERLSSHQPRAERMSDAR